MLRSSWIKKSLVPLALIATLLPAGCKKRQWAGLVISHGEVVEVKNYLTQGKYTIFDFFSVDCPNCVTLSPYLEKLAIVRSDIALVKVDVDRPGSRGIDWGSPVARRYEIDKLPHLMLFDKSGKLLAQGDEALEQVGAWIDQIERK